MAPARLCQIQAGMMFTVSQGSQVPREAQAHKGLAMAVTWVCPVLLQNPQQGCLSGAEPPLATLCQFSAGTLFLMAPRLLWGSAVLAPCHLCLSTYHVTSSESSLSCACQTAG